MLTRANIQAPLPSTVPTYHATGISTLATNIYAYGLSGG
jgi:hypothetical protein